jgi:type VI secretion system secreted protein VgrG
MAKATTKARLLDLETPLGADKLLLQAFHGTEAISELFVFRLECYSDDLSIDPEKILGKNVTFGVTLSDNKSKRHFNGFVSRFSQLPGQQGYALYHAEVVPWLWFLTLTADCRIFQDKKVPEIIEEIFSDFGFTDYELKLNRSYRKWPYCVQYRETAANFVMRLMEQEGIFFFFTHENGKHQLVLGDSTSAHAPASPEEVEYVPFEHAARVREQDVVRSWRREFLIRSGKYAIQDYNFEKPSTSMMVNTNTTIDVGGNASLELFDYPGEYDEVSEGDQYVKDRMEEQEALYDTVTGEGGARHFGAGQRIKLKGHVRRDQDGAYCLTTVTHMATSNLPWEDTSHADYSNSFTCIPSSVTYRPPRRTPKPVVQGSQTAMVVGPAGEELHVDKYGRVKVQFHWDRRGQRNDKSSCWIRVSQPVAGAKWGSSYVPRIGQEVVVSFLEGDPDDPLIVGSVYNANSMPPYYGANKYHMTGFKSFSTKGGGGFNEWRFDDTKGSEQIFIHGEKQFDLRIKKDRLEWIGNDDHLMVKKDRFESVDGDQHLTVKGDQNEEVKGTVSLKAGQDIQQKAGMKHALNAGQEIHLKAGMNVVIEAGMQLTLKAGSSFIVIGPAGIDIVGSPLVKINSGGSAGSGAGANPNPPKPPKEADKAEAGEKEKQLARPKPPKPQKYGVQATVLKEAAESGTPFCEICNS